MDSRELREDTKAPTKASSGEIVKLYQLLKISFSMAYSNTMTAVGSLCALRLAPTARLLALFSGFKWNRGFNASESRSLHTHCYSTHFSLNDEDILYKNTTF